MHKGRKKWEVMGGAPADFWHWASYHVKKYLYLYWPLKTHSAFTTVCMCVHVQGHISACGGLTYWRSWLCLKDPMFGCPGHVHKLSVRDFTLQTCSHPPLSSSILCRCSAGGRRSWNCSRRPVLSSMLPLRASGAELQHRPPLSSTLRTLIHTPERGSYLKQHTYKHTHKLSKACVCVYLLAQTPSGSKKTHLLRSFADSVCASVSVCILHLGLCIHTPLFTVNKDRFHFINKLMFIWMINLKLVLVCRHSEVWFFWWAPCGRFSKMNSRCRRLFPMKFTWQQWDFSMVHFTLIIKKLVLKRWFRTNPAHIHCWVCLGWTHSDPLTHAHTYLCCYCS